MTTGFVVLDIETVPALTPKVTELLERDIRPDGRLKDPEKIRADLEQKRGRIAADAALSPWSGAVAAIGVHYLAEAEPRCFLPTDFGACPDVVTCEPAMLAAFLAWLRACGSECQLVTFNGRRFDVPFLAARCARYDLGPLWSLPLLGQRRFTHHLDLKTDLLGDVDGGLELAATALLGRAKAGTGTDVAAWAAQGHWDQIKAYCLDDVELTKAIFEKYRRETL